MGTITLKNLRTTADVKMNTTLKDGGIFVDWADLTDIKAWLWSDTQRALAGRCDVRVDANDSTKLVCEYASTKPQYPGVNRLIVQASYMGATKTYDKPAFNFVRWTGDQAGQQVTIDDPEVNVDMEVTDVTSSILQEAIAAALAAAAHAEHAASLVPLQVLQDCEAATAVALTAAAHAPQIGENGNWWIWSSAQNAYVDTGKVARGATGNGIASFTVVESQEDDGENTVTVTFTDGEQETFTVKNGKTGNGIASIVQTVESPDDAGTNVITITMTNGTVVTFNVKNGSKGQPGAAQAAYKSVAELPTASAETMDKIYLTPSGTAGVYNMSYTDYDGSAYSWVSLGTTAIQLADYATKAEVTDLEEKKEDKRIFVRKDIVKDIFKELFLPDADLSTITKCQVSCASLYAGSYYNIIRFGDSSVYSYIILTKAYNTEQEAVDEFKKGLFINPENKYSALLDTTLLSPGDNLSFYDIVVTDLSLDINNSPIILANLNKDELESELSSAVLSIQGNYVNKNRVSGTIERTDNDKIPTINATFFALKDLESNENPIIDIPIDKVGYVKSNGTISTNTSARMSDYVYVAHYTRIKAYTLISSGGCAVAFYDENLNFLSNVSVVGTNARQTIDMAIPESAKFVVVSQYSFNAATMTLINENRAPNFIDLVDKLESVEKYPLSVIRRECGFAALFDNWGFVGDSLSSGNHNVSGTPSNVDFPEYSWGQYMCRLTGADGVNFSFGGATTKSWLEYTGAKGWGGCKQNPRKCYIIAMGCNDCAGANPIPVGDVSTDIGTYDPDTDTDTNAATFAGYYAGIIQRLKSIQPKAKIFVVTLPQGDRSLANTYNEVIRAMPTIFSNVFVIDLWTYAPPVNGVWATRYRKLYHLNTIGYLYTAYEIMNYIDWIVRNNYDKFNDVALIGTEYNAPS